MSFPLDLGGTAFLLSIHLNLGPAYGIIATLLDSPVVNCSTCLGPSGLKLMLGGCMVRTPKILRGE